MKRLLSVLLVSMCLLALVACGDDAGSAESMGGGSFNDGLDFEMNETPKVENLKLIYEADIVASTENYKEFVASLKKEVSELKGYFSTFNESINGINSSARVVIRIPTENYEAAKESIASIGEIVSSEHNIIDVTNSYIDVETRLTTLRAQKTALDEMLAKATTVTEMLEIQREITNVTTEIETYQARLNSLDGRIAYSTINLRINGVERIEPVKEGAFARIGSKFVGSLKGIWNVIVEIFVFIIGYLPIFIVLGGATVGAILIYVRHKKKNRGDK